VCIARGQRFSFLSALRPPVADKLAPLLFLTGATCVLAMMMVSPLLWGRRAAAAAAVVVLRRKPGSTSYSPLLVRCSPQAPSFLRGIFCTAKRLKSPPTFTSVSSHQILSLFCVHSCCCLNRPAALCMHVRTEWLGLLNQTKGGGGLTRSDTSWQYVRWGDAGMLQTHALFMATLALSACSLLLALALVLCVVLAALLPAYHHKPPRWWLPSRPSLTQHKQWRWTFALLTLCCLMGLLLSPAIFLRLPSCLSHDLPGLCSTGLCASLLSWRREGGNFLLYIPFAGWFSTIASFGFVLVNGILFFAFCWKCNCDRDGQCRTLFSGSKGIRREVRVASADPIAGGNDDEDAGERQPLLLSCEKADRSKATSERPFITSAINGTHEKRSCCGHDVSIVVEVGEAPIEQCDSPLAHYKPCPSSPTPVRLRSISSLSLSPPTVADGEREKKADPAAVASEDPSKTLEELGEDNSASDCSFACTEALVEPGQDPQPVCSDGTAEDHTKNIGFEDQEPVSTLEKGEEMEQLNKPVTRRAFATKQRVSYKDIAKKASIPAPESALGVERVRRTPRRVTMRGQAAALLASREKELAAHKLHTLTEQTHPQIKGDEGVHGE